MQNNLFCLTSNAKKMPDKNQSLQSKFLEAVKELIPPNKALVTEISDILDVSSDSAYRRIRGETSLTLDEVSKIAKVYNLSLDSLIGTGSGAVTFNYHALKSLSDYRDYLISIDKDLEMIEKAQESSIYYAANDLPIFHHFRYEKLSAFKTFYWIKSVVNDPDFSNMHFDINSIPQELIDIGKNIYERYCRINSYEVWTDITISSTIKQIEYYWEAGIFESENDVLDVCNELREEISYIKRQAEMKSKCLVSDSSNSAYPNNYFLHISEIEIGNNCIYVLLNDKNVVYLSYHTFNKMQTTNAEFCKETSNWMNGLISRSTLISGVAEKQRYQFFRNMFSKIDKLVYRITES